MSSPYFSVVIDNYNYGRFIAQALDSVLAQDFPAAEVETIVVDDGSTDNSREVLARYQDKIRVIFQKNSGQSGAFAAGFAAAKGQVVCLLDSDDYWLPEKLSLVARKLRDPAIAIVQHYQHEVDIEGRWLKNQLPPWPETYRLQDVLNGQFHYAATSSLAFRKSLLDKALPVPQDIFFLYDLYLVDHVLLYGDAGNISRVLGCHRLHGANNWARGFTNPDKMEGNIRELRAYQRYFEPKLHAVGRAFSPQYLTLQDLEIRKREILIAMRRGRRGKALKAWKGLAAAHGNTLFGAFRAATCLVALISPDLYLRLYDFYASQGWFGRARNWFFPLAPRKGLGSDTGSDPVSDPRGP